MSRKKEVEVITLDDSSSDSDNLPPKETNRGGQPSQNSQRISITIATNHRTPVVVKVVNCQSVSKSVPGPSRQSHHAGGGTVSSKEKQKKRKRRLQEDSPEDIYRPSNIVKRDRSYSMKTKSRDVTSRALFQYSDIKNNDHKAPSTSRHHEVKPTLYSHTHHRDDSEESSTSNERTKKRQVTHSSLPSIINVLENDPGLLELLEAGEQMSKDIKVLLPKYNAQRQVIAEKAGLRFPIYQNTRVGGKIQEIKHVSDLPIQSEYPKVPRRILNEHDIDIEEQGLRDDLRLAIKYALERKQVEARSTQDDNGEYMVSRIKDWNWYDDGTIKPLVEWEDWPGADTYEPIEYVIDTDAFEVFEKFIFEALGMSSNWKSADKMSLELLVEFKNLIDSKLMVSREEKHLALPFQLLLLGKTISDFNSESGFNKDYSKLNETIRRKFKHFIALDIVLKKKTPSEANRKSLDKKLHPTTMLAVLNRHFKPKSLKEVMSFPERYKNAQIKLKEWKCKLEHNMKKAGENLEFGTRPILKVTNEVDETLPSNFTYVMDYIPTEKISFITKPAYMSCSSRYCKCTLGNTANDCCPCVLQDLYTPDWFPYTNEGKLKMERSSYIFECNDDCDCKEECHMRVTSRKLTHLLEIFRTDDGRGWGLRTRREIRRGQFIMRYAGVLRDIEDVNKELEAGVDNDYLMSLDYGPLDPQKVVVVDSSEKGNLSRFINHSCNPNLIPRAVFSGSYDPYIPRVAFFALRDIKFGEELTFDYMIDILADRDNEDFAHIVNLDEDDKLCMWGDPSLRIPAVQTTIQKKYYKKRERIECKCGSTDCRVFFN